LGASGGGKMKIGSNDPLTLGIIASLIAGVILAFFGYLLSRLRKSGFGMFELFRRGSREKTGLETYRQTLEDRTLRISHPWMKEDQTLTDILVPINLQTKKATQREELEIYLAREFKKNQSLRLLLLGKPGSGKTIAMRVIARILWTFNEENPVVPVLMNFSDIKGITDKEGLKKKIIEKLIYYQFEQGKKDDNTAKQFVEENLYEGKLFLLFDGYDELDKSARVDAAKLLNTFLGAYPNIPAAISSRTALYQSELAFDQLKPCKISMAPFTPFAILKFLSLWKFEGKKSSHELFDMINGKAHLSELASNPLMLTIITFLYSLPKYTLPDNRVEFYEQCTRALLEEWDRAKQTDRANKYESHQKVSILNRLAFEHVSKADINDELIDEKALHPIVREEMKKLSLKVEEYPLMEKEIIQNSGLLQFIPAADYRFPHRTFMEFFAASYLDEEKSYRDMLELYRQDPEKWKEVLLLYMGLNKNKEYTNTILKDLIADFEDNFINKRNPNPILFSTLTQCAVPNPDLAEDIMELAHHFLKEHPEKEVIEELGFIAANPRWYHAKRAKKLLLEMLDWKLPDEAFQQVIFSLLHAGDESLDEIILENLKRFNLAEFFSKISSKQKYFVNRLFSLDLPDVEKKNIIDGLKEAGNLEILRHLLIENSDEYIREHAAYGLFQMSKLDGFYDFLDKTEIGFLDEKTRKEVDKKFEEWGWRWELPKTENGEKIAILICYYSTNWIVNNKDDINEESLDQVDKRFRYLTTGFLVEKGIPFHKFNLIGFKYGETATKWGLKRHWRKEINLNNLWYKICDINFITTHEIDEVWKLVGSLMYWVTSFIGIVGFMQYHFGATSNGFYKFFFDPFTANVLFFQFIPFSILNLMLYRQISDTYLGDSLVSSTAGIFQILDSFDDIKWVPIVFLLLSIPIFFIPFHNTLFNIALFLHFFILGEYFLEDKHINFALFNIYNIEKVYYFLNEPELNESYDISRSLS
jgi:hypothetical protein